MKLKKFTYLSLFAAFTFTFLMADSCNPDSDDIQRQQQEKILSEGTAQVGMPNIVNFREKKLLKLILEKRDQNGLVTYTYVENMNPTIVHGYTALGGKFTFLGESIGFGIPYATQFTNPQKPVDADYHATAVIAQADPNGLFSPSDAEGTWILMLNPQTKETEPQYIEPRIAVFTYKLPVD